MSHSRSGPLPKRSFPFSITRTPPTWPWIWPPAPREQIKTINYLIDGARPTPSAGELADAVRERVPDAEITFEPDVAAAITLSRNLVIDDQYARREWGWQPAYGLEAMIDDFLAEVAA